jgi:3-hydroxyacyl-[acyl-carrier-protein] dehydratase
MDIHEIMRMLPHRYPMLFVDRVTECHPGKSIHGIKNLSRSDEFMTSAHVGPTTQAMPTLLVVEALAQISVILTYKSLEIEPSDSDLMFFAGIDTARFGAHAACGESLHLNAEVKRLRKSVGWFKGLATVSNRVVCEVEMMAAWKSG